MILFIRVFGIFKPAPTHNLTILFFVMSVMFGFMFSYIGLSHSIVIVNLPTYCPTIKQREHICRAIARHRMSCAHFSKTEITSFPKSGY